MTLKFVYLVITIKQSLIIVGLCTNPEGIPRLVSTSDFTEMLLRRVGKKRTVSHKHKSVLERYITYS